MFYHDGKNIPSMPIKDPDNLTSYGFDWSAWLLEGDEVYSSEWSVPDGLQTEGGEYLEDNVTGISLSGGVEGDTYRVSNKITTEFGYIDERSMDIPCKNK